MKREWVKWRTFRVRVTDLRTGEGVDRWLLMRDGIVVREMKNAADGFFYAFDLEKSGAA